MLCCTFCNKYLSKCFSYLEGFGPEVASFRVRLTELRSRSPVINGVIMVEHPANNPGSVRPVEGRMQLVTVPDEVEVVTRNQKRVWIDALEVQEFLVARLGSCQIFAASIMRQ